MIHVPDPFLRQLDRRSMEQFPDQIDEVYFGVFGLPENQTLERVL